MERLSWLPRRAAFPFRSMRLLVLCAALSTAGVAPAHAGPILSIEPTATNVVESGAFSLEVTIADVLDLYAYQVSLSYDPAILMATGLTEGPFLDLAGTGNFFAGDDSTPGLITFIGNALTGAVPGVSGSGTLFIVQFSAIAPGSTGVAVLLDSANGDEFLDSALNSISLDALNSASVDVRAAAVPEPGILLLIGSGLVAAGAARRQARSKALFHRSDAASRRS